SNASLLKIVSALPGGTGGRLHLGVLPTSILPSQNSRNLFSWLSMSSSLSSNAAALRRTAAVVRNRRDVADHHDVEAGGGKSAYGGLASGTGTLNADLHALHPVLVTR